MDVDFEEERSLVFLPNEVLERIWRQNELDYVDICRLGSVCKKFHELSKSNDVWRAKTFWRWPQLRKYYNEKALDCSWKEEFILQYSCDRKVQPFVESLVSQFYHEEDISTTHFEQFRATAQDCRHPEMVILAALEKIINDGSGHCNLTTKYYAGKALRFFKHVFVKKEFRHFLAQPAQEQLLETGASLIAQWCQLDKECSAQVIASKLDALADRVQLELQTKCPDHPACHRQNQHHLAESLWSPNQCCVVLETLNYVLFKNLGFRGNQADFYNEENSCINVVLDTRLGIPITLGVVYIALARRLGVVCEPVNSPWRFLVRWKEHPISSPDLQYTYIDVFDEGKFLNVEQCKELLSVSGEVDLEGFGVPTTEQVLQRMVRNLLNIGQRVAQMGNLLCLQTALELFTSLWPSEGDMVLLLAKVYLHRGINLSEVIAMLQEVQNAVPSVATGMVAYLMQTAEALIEEERSITTNDVPQAVQPKRRSKDKGVLYSVGMIMHHKRYDYTCVIYGWDGQCKASGEWIQQMGVHLLPNKDQQPFYNVLVSDGSNRYAAQESLEIHPSPSPVTHPEVGRHFTKYCTSYYMANPLKAKEYPDDVEFTQNQLRKRAGDATSASMQ